MEPPPCRRRARSTLPTLMEELVQEILIRIPPDEPADLVRAALVCKPWRRIIISDPGFLRRYREFHRRRPPLLGFFYNDFGERVCPSFMPAATAFPTLPDDYRICAWRILDSRHGRVLLSTLHAYDRIIVWDPISNEQQKLQLREHAIAMRCQTYCFAVLCAVTGCDHHNCRGGPFLVVYLGVDSADDTIFKVCVYSSEACAWGTPVSYQLDRGCYCDTMQRAAVVGDDIYCVVTPGARIIKYDLVRHCISSFSSPPMCREASHRSQPFDGDIPVFMQNEDGLLGLASVRDSRLHLWSSSRMVVNRWGKLVAKWEQMCVIELDKILPIDKPCDDGVYVASFVEGVGVLLIRTDVGTFTFELESGRVRKISMSTKFRTAFPFITFFTSCKAPTALY